jgi:hypothetical protein
MAGLTTNSNNLLAGMPLPDTLRAPEIEKGLACDFDSYLLEPDNTLDERITAAKTNLGKDVVILGTITSAMKSSSSRIIGVTR